MPQSATPFLMFEGRAEEAMTFYVSVFAAARIEDIRRYGAGGPGKEGSVMLARFSIAGQDFLCSDSPVHHDFTFTPSLSIFVTCENEAELDAAFTRLSEGGFALMAPGNYGFSKKFAWVADRFGVSWQLNLP